MTTWAVLAELRAARCLVAPSLWYETGPLTVIEAMAQGVPPVLPRSTGAAGRVRDGVDGLLLETVGEPDLAAALSALQDGPTAERLGLSAYETHWSDPPTLERHVEALLRSYRSVMAKAA